MAECKGARNLCCRPGQARLKRAQIRDDMGVWCARLPLPRELIRRQRDLVVDQRIQCRLHVDLGVDDAGLLEGEAGQVD